MSASVLREVPQAGLWKMVTSGMVVLQWYRLCSPRVRRRRAIQHTAKPERKRSARQLGHDESRNAGWRNAGEGVAEHASPGRGRVGETRGGGEPEGGAV